MRQPNIQEYLDYLKTLQKSIFKILPLYEEENIHLQEYVTDLYREVDNVLDIVKPLPHGAWYFTTKSNLKILIYEVQLKDNKKSVKKKTLHITALIESQITESKRC